MDKTSHTIQMNDLLGLHGYYKVGLRSGGRAFSLREEGMGATVSSAKQWLRRLLCNALKPFPKRLEVRAYGIHYFLKGSVVAAGRSKLYTSRPSRRYWWPGLEDKLHLEASFVLSVKPGSGSIVVSKQ